MKSIQDKQTEVPQQTMLFEVGGNDDILAALSEFFGYQKWEIEQHSRKHHLVEARHMIMYILREYSGMSFPAIGRLIGNRDHTTIIHGYNKTRKEVADNPTLVESLGGPIALAQALKARKLEVQKELEGMNAQLYAQAMENIRLSRELSRAPRVRTIPERDMKVLEMYREGLTLRNISSVFGLSGERIRQIVLTTIQYLAVNESLTKGIVMDIDVLIEEETKKRKSAQEAKKPIKQIVVKEKRWSTYYDACKECDSAVYKHLRFGLCERCLGGFRGEVREKIIAEHLNQCDICHISRAEAKRTYGRDFYIKKDKTVLCKGDFLADTARKLGSYKYHEWSRHHPECKGCQTTTIRHARKGLCEKCSGYISPERREQIIRDHGSKCDECDRSREDQLEKFGTDLRLTKTERTLCLNCFPKYIKANKGS